MTSSNVFLKDGDATLDFAFDWTDWLATGELVTAHEVTAGTGLTVASHSELNGVITYWLTGGTVGDTYAVTCRVTTNANRTDERTAWINVVNR